VLPVDVEEHVHHEAWRPRYLPFKRAGAQANSTGKKSP
jgi:hypothetical protein